jgi:hypothetical protein
MTGSALPGSPDLPVLKPGTTYKEASNLAFAAMGTSSGERRGKQPAMTAPVHMGGADSSRMRFVMPEGPTMDSLPTPNDPNASWACPEEVLAVLRFGGFSSDAIAPYAEILLGQRRPLVRSIVRCATGLRPASSWWRAGTKWWWRCGGRSDRSETSARTSRWAPRLVQ